MQRWSIVTALGVKVEAFVPDPKPTLQIETRGAEGVAVIGDSVYGAQVAGSRGVLKYEKK